MCLYLEKRGRPWLDDRSLDRERYLALDALLQSLPVNLGPGFLGEVDEVFGVPVVMAKKIQCGLRGVVVPIVPGAVSAG